MSEIDWNDDEAVVKARFFGALVFADNSGRIWYMNKDTAAQTLLGDDWLSARRTVGVAAWEAKRNPAKQPAGEGSAVGERQAIAVGESYAAKDGGIYIPRITDSKYGFVWFTKSTDGHNSTHRETFDWWASKVYGTTLPDPQPSPVDATITTCKHCGLAIEPTVPPFNEWRHTVSRMIACEETSAEPIAKPVDDLAELGRLAKEASRTGATIEDIFEFERACSPDRIQSLIDRVREGEAERDEFKAAWRAAGDVAKAQVQVAARVRIERNEARADLYELRQALQAEREKTARLEDELSRLRFASSYEGLQDGQER